MFSNRRTHEYEESRTRDACSQSNDGRLAQRLDPDSSPGRLMGCRASDSLPAVELLQVQRKFPHRATRRKEAGRGRPLPLGASQGSLRASLCCPSCLVVCLQPLRLFHRPPSLVFLSSSSQLSFQRRPGRPPTLLFHARYSPPPLPTHALQGPDPRLCAASRK